MVLKVCGEGATKLVLTSLPNDINEVRNQCISLANSGGNFEEARRYCKPRTNNWL